MSREQRPTHPARVERLCVADLPFAAARSPRRRQLPEGIAAAMRGRSDPRRVWSGSNRAWLTARRRCHSGRRQTRISSSGGHSASLGLGPPKGTRARTKASRPDLLPRRRYRKDEAYHPVGQRWLHAPSAEVGPKSRPTSDSRTQPGSGHGVPERHRVARRSAGARLRLRRNTCMPLSER